MEWHRRYHGTNRDAKLEMVARRAKLPRPYAIAAWDAAMEWASANEDDRGDVSAMSAEWMAVDIGCEDEEAARLIAAMTNVGLIRDGRLPSWERRNPSDPTAAERMRRMRQRRNAEPEGHDPNGSGGGYERDTVTSVTHRNAVTQEQSRTEQTLPPNGGASPEPAEPMVHKAPKPSGTLEAELFRRGKAALGGSAGGLIAAVKRDHGIDAVAKLIARVEGLDQTEARELWVKTAQGLDRDKAAGKGKPWARERPPDPFAACRAKARKLLAAEGVNETDPDFLVKLSDRALELQRDAQRRPAAA